MSAKAKYEKIDKSKLNDSLLKDIKCDERKKQTILKMKKLLNGLKWKKH